MASATELGDSKAVPLLSAMPGVFVEALATDSLLQGRDLQRVPRSLVALITLLIVFGAGQAMVMAPLFGRVLAKVPQAHAGSGAGVLSTVQQIGSASGVAVIGAIYFGLGQTIEPRVAVAISLALLAVAFVALAALLREPRCAPAA